MGEPMSSQLTFASQAAEASAEGALYIPRSRFHNLKIALHICIIIYIYVIEYIFIV